MFFEDSKEEKIEVDLHLSYRLRYPRHVLVMSCTDRADNSKITTMAWSIASVYESADGYTKLPSNNTPINFFKKLESM